MELKEKIVILRKARHFSQQELGDRLGKATFGLSRQSIYDWEKGNSEPKLDNLRELANVLNVSFDVLLDESCDLSDSVTLQKVLLGTYGVSSNEVDLPDVKIDIKRRTILPHICVSIFLILLLAGVISISVIYGFSIGEVPYPQSTTIIGKLDELTKSLTIANGNLTKFKICILVLLISLPFFFIGGILLIKIPSTKNVGYFSQKGIVFKNKKLKYIPFSLIKEIRVNKGHLFNKKLVISDNDEEYSLKHIYHPEEIQYSFEDLKKY